MIPYLRTAKLIVVTGPEALTVIERLRVDAASGGIRAVHICDCVHVDPARFAAVMTSAARDIGAPVLVNPFPDRAAEMIRDADLHVVAPSGTGNRIWFIPEDGDGFSAGLPDFTPRECREAITALLDGATFDDPRLKRPRLTYPSTWSEAVAATLPRCAND